MNLHYIVAVFLITLGLYCLLSKRNLIKLIIGLSVMTDGIHLFLVSLGYRATAGVTAPIVTGDLSQFANLAVDPLPQALILTSIVINICTTALALSLAIYSYKHYRTLNPFKMRRLKG
jgi:multicomponent Na+:H+ antiporter subunit C